MASGSRWCAWREALSRALPPGWCRSSSLGMQVIFALGSVYQSHSGLSSQVRSCSTCGAHKQTNLHRGVAPNWIGVLRAEGSTALLAPQQVLADGATYELLLQRQPGGQ